MSTTAKPHLHYAGGWWRCKADELPFEARAVTPAFAYEGWAQRYADLRRSVGVPLGVLHCGLVVECPT